MGLKIFDKNPPVPSPVYSFNIHVCNIKFHKILPTKAKASLDAKPNNDWT